MTASGQGGKFSVNYVSDGMEARERCRGPAEGWQAGRRLATHSIATKTAALRIRCCHYGEPPPKRPSQLFLAASVIGHVEQFLVKATVWGNPTIRVSAVNRIG